MTMFTNRSPGWIGFGLISAVSGSLTWQGLRGTPLGTRDSGKGAIARSLYGWGVVFALGHYVFGPPVSPPPSTLHFVTKQQV